MEQSETVAEKPTPDPIDEEQVELAKIMVKQLHPIRKTYIDIAFPWACCLCGMVRKGCTSGDAGSGETNETSALLEADFVQQENASSRQSKLAEAQRKQHEEDVMFLHDMSNTDPYNTMGYGLIAYRQTLLFFSYAFIFLTILAAPIMLIYKDGDYQNGNEAAKMMLGHLGYATVRCQTAEFVMENLIVDCNYGQINALISAGMNDPDMNSELPAEYQGKDLCMLDDDEDTYKNKGCSDFINRDFFNNFFDENCKERDTCTVNFRDSDLFNSDIDAGTPTDGDGTCMSNPMTQFFIQYTCEETNMDALSKKYDNISLICAIILFIGFFFILLIYYMQSISKLEQKTYDMNTITAADFTVEFDITEEMWDNFKDKEMGKYPGYSEARAFKRELKHDVEREIRKSIQTKKDRHGGEYVPSAGKGAGKKPKHKKKVGGMEEEDPDAVRIVDITFAFNNHKMINLLKKRGAAITALNFDKMRLHDEELTAMIHDDECYNDFTRPVCAFITFENDDHYNEACSFAKKKGLAAMQAAAHMGKKDEEEKVAIEVLGNSDPEFHAATEPTNIIWENRHIKGVDFGLRACSAITIVIMMLIITFIVILVSKSKSIQNQALIPKRGKDFCPALVDSIGMKDALVDNYEDNKEDLFAKEEQDGGYVMVYNADAGSDCADSKPCFNKLFYLAGLEYMDWQENNFETQMNGPLQCFCKQVKKDYDDEANYFLNFVWNTEYTIETTAGDLEQHPICQTLVESETTIKIINNCIKFGIIAVNVAIRMAVIAIIAYIGCSTESHQMTYITDSVFLCQFFNTGFLLMLCGANLTQQPILAHIPGLPVGSMSDFNSAWFDQLGATIKGSLIFGAVFPIANECGQLGKRTTFRLLDKLPAANGLTRKTTIQQYVNLHSGPEYFMHYKYSGLMNVVFLTMMFGTGMPELFPVAALSFVVLYSIENYMLYYLYKKPPDYDEKLNDSILANMAKAPLFLYAFGYWMLSNKQLLQTYDVYDVETQKGGLAAITYKGEAFQAGHFWYEFLNPASVFQSGPAGSLLLAFWAYFWYLVFRTPVSWCVNKCCGKYVLHDVEIDDDIDKYQNCLDDDDKKWSALEEQGLNKFGIISKNPEDNAIVANGVMKDKKMHLTGVHCYNILRNPRYAQAFQYFAVYSDRKGLIIDDDKDETNDEAQSDIVAIALNLAYLTREDLNEMKFDKESLTEISKKHGGSNAIN